MIPCPTAEELGAYIEGTLSPPPRQGVEMHLAGCPRCRAHVILVTRHLAQARPAETGGRGWARWAVAAAVLLAAAWWARHPSGQRLPAPPPPPLSPTPGPAPSFPDSPLEARGGARWWALPGGTRVALAEGGLASVGRDGALLLDHGTLWVEGQSALRQVRTALGGIRLDGAECLIRLDDAPPGMGAALFREALAGESGKLTVACLRGSLTVQGEAGGVAVPEGQWLEVAGGRPSGIRPLPAGSRGALLGWIEALRTNRVYAGTKALEALGVSLRSSTEGVILEGRGEGGQLSLPDPGPGDYTLEVTLKPRKQEGDLGIAFPAGNAAFPFWVLPVKTLGGSVSRLTVRRHGDLVRFSHGGQSAVTGRQARSMTPAAEGPGVKVWGAEVEVLEVRVAAWKPAP